MFVLVCSVFVVVRESLGLSLCFPTPMSVCLFALKVQRQKGNRVYFTGGSSFKYPMKSAALLFALGDLDSKVSCIRGWPMGLG